MDSNFAKAKGEIIIKGVLITLQWCIILLFGSVNSAIYRNLQMLLNKSDILKQKFLLVTI